MRELLTSRISWLQNNDVHWVPEYIGKNRFGRWLEGALAIGRITPQRYWGALLPIWRNPKTKEYKVFGSLRGFDLPRAKKSGNTYLLMRHAEAESKI